MTIRYRHHVPRTARCLLPAEPITRPWLYDGVRQSWTSELPQIAILGAPARAANGAP